MDSLAAYPGGYAGRGIVTCAGGLRYNTCAWVLIKLLRHFGCVLPIQAWYLGERERFADWIELVRPLGVECIDAHQVRQRHAHPRLNGWELKPYAILHSCFQEVMFLDADNVPVRNPTYLFNEPDYKRTGAVLWPDPPHIRTGPDSLRWQVFGVEYRDEREAESGQLLIDKRRCWRPLQLCNWYNRHSDFFYRYVYGDKDTFRFAWHRCRQPFAMTPYDLEELPHTLCQRDFQGRCVFQHRFNAKWSLFENLKVPGFQWQELCLEFLAELRRCWQPATEMLGGSSSHTPREIRGLAGRRFDVVRSGYGRRPLELLADGYVGEGGDFRHAMWWIKDGRLLVLDGGGYENYRLSSLPGNTWCGSHAQDPNRLVRLQPQAVS